INFRLEMDLSSSLFTEGSGKVAINKSLSKPIVASESNLAFGILERGATVDKEIQLQNLSTASYTISPHVVAGSRKLSIDTRPVSDTTGDFVTLSGPAVLAGGATDKINVHLAVPASMPSGYYEGKIKMSNDMLQIPYSFILTDDIYFHPTNSMILP